MTTQTTTRIPEIKTTITVTQNHQIKSNDGVVISYPDKSFTLPIDIFHENYFENVKHKIGPVFNTILTNLIRSRDYLGLQLNFEFENITEQQYLELEKEYLIEPKKVKAEDLKEEIKTVYDLTDRVFTSEEISTMFNCDVEQAEKAIDLLIKERNPLLCQ